MLRSAMMYRRSRTTSPAVDRSSPVQHLTTQLPILSPRSLSFFHQIRFALFIFFGILMQFAPADCVNTRSVPTWISDHNVTFYPPIILAGGTS